MFEHQSVVDLFQKAEQDVALREALQRCQSPEEAVQVAADAGVIVSPQQLRDFGQYLVDLQKRVTDGELSDADLEAVAGGWFFSTMIAGMVAGGCTVGIGGLGVALGGCLGVAGTLMAVNYTQGS